MERALVEILFIRYRLPVYRFLRRLLSDELAAEDLTQEVFVRALGAAYAAGEHERAWVFQIARNLARDHLRRASHRGPTLESADEPAPFIDTALALEIRAAIGRLADADREVFLLREVAGLTYDEIAVACSITPDAVRNRLHRTRLALREALTLNIVPMHRVRT